MSSPLTDVVSGYAALGSELLRAWSDQATKVARNLDAGTYDADTAAKDLASSASLAVQTGFLLVTEALDGAATLSAAKKGPQSLDSEPFLVPVPEAVLTLAGPLKNGFASDTLIATIVREPPAPDGTFVLRANPRGHRSGTYVGQVDVTVPGARLAPLPVWIVVP